MRSFWVALTLLAGCVSPRDPSSLDDSGSKAAPLSSQDRDRLEKALRSVHEAPYVSMRFETRRTQGPGSRGISRAYRSGVVFVEEETDGEPRAVLLRVGTRAWVSRDGWTEADDPRLAGAGTGFQDPYTAVAKLLEGLNECQAPEDGAYRMTLHPRDADFIGDHFSRAADKSSALGSMTWGTLRFTESGMPDARFKTNYYQVKTGHLAGNYEIEYEVLSFGPAPPMRFDEIPAPFTPDMKAAVRKALQEEGK